MPYNPTLVAPMREEMTRMGARELKTPDEVDALVAALRRVRRMFD